MFNDLKALFFPRVQIHYKDSKAHILALDGLRGFAILLVLLFHMFGFMLGWCGVDVFFVLSGFLITGILIDSKAQAHYFRDFWTKRILRIFPLYYLVLSLILLPKLISQINTVSITSWTYWLYLHNWKYVSDGVFPDGKDTLNHFWSLAIEEQFYLFFPFVIHFNSLKKLPYILISFIFIAISLRYFYFQRDNIGYYVATFARMDSLAIGGLIAYLTRFQKAWLEKWIHLFFYVPFIYIFSVIAITGDMHFSNPYFATGGLALFALLFGSLLVYSISVFKYNIIQQIFEKRMMRFIGKIAYGLYVYHWILYVFLKPVLRTFIYENVIQIETLVKLAVSVIVLTATLLISLLSFRFFETPFIRLRRIFLK